MPLRNFNIPRLTTAMVPSLGYGSFLFIDDQDDRLKLASWEVGGTQVVDDISGPLSSGAGSTLRRTVGANYVVQSDDYALDVTTPGPLFLPTPTDSRELTIKALVGGVVLTPSAGVLVEGLASLELLVANESSRLIANGASWRVYG